MLVGKELKTRIYSKSIRVIGVTKSELVDLQRLVNDVNLSKTGKGELQTSPTQYLAIEVSDSFQWISEAEKRAMRQRHTELERD